jgi:hypothetical protein
MSRTSAPRTKLEAAAPAPPFAPEPEVHLLSAEDTREETRALIARAMRSAARFVEAHPQHENTPQILAALSDYYGTTSHELAKGRELQVLFDVASDLGPLIARLVESSIENGNRAREELDRLARETGRGSGRSKAPAPPSETPPSEQPPQAGASEPVITHLTKDAA